MTAAAAAAARWEAETRKVRRRKKKGGIGGFWGRETTLKGVRGKLGEGGSKLIPK